MSKIKLFVLGAFAVVALGVVGCSSNGSLTPAQQCMITETAICAAEYDPVQNRAQFGQCLAVSAQACGVVPMPVPPAPISTPTPTVVPTPAGK